MRHIFPIFIALFLLTGCTQRGCQKFEKNFQYTERSYEIFLYSGGQVVFYDQFTGIINQEESSDGFFLH